MQNFTFRNPVEIIFGKGSIEKIPKRIDPSSRILILYGGGSVIKNGTLEKVKKALSSYDVLEFGGIEANPEFSTLKRAADFAIENKRNFLLAVGGGSVFDGTKFIAAVCKDIENAENIFYRRSPINDALPWAGILTLPATGSEMNSGAVISYKEKGLKLSVGSPLLFPQFSVLDPETTFSLPKRQLANGVVDAFVHVLEQYLTKPCGNDTVDYLAEAVLRAVMDTGKKTYLDMNDYEARSNFMWAATMALNGYLGIGAMHDWSTHLIGHQVTALSGLDHARSLAAILPSLLQVRKEAKREKLLQLGTRIFNLPEKECTTELVIENIKEFLAFFSMPLTLKQAAETADITVKSILSKMEESGLKAIGENQEVVLEVMEEILILATERGL